MMPNSHSKSSFTHEPPLVPPRFETFLFGLSVRCTPESNSATPGDVALRPTDATWSWGVGAFIQNNVGSKYAGSSCCGDPLSRSRLSAPWRVWLAECSADVLFRGRYGLLCPLLMAMRRLVVLWCSPSHALLSLLCGRYGLLRALCQ